jgi:hypothetical protein
MKTLLVGVRLSAAAVGLGFLLGVSTHQAQAQLGKAEVQGVKGNATYTYGTGSPMQLKRGLALPAGSSVHVERDSAVDLFLGHEAGTIRVTQNTVLALDKLDPKLTFLTLNQGSIVGWDAHVPMGSEYQVKLPNGIVGIVDGKYRLDARSYLVLVNGAMVYGYVPAGGQPTPIVMRAPPPTYFSPMEGIKHAPAVLEREVDLQTKGKLR